MTCSNTPVSLISSLCISEFFFLFHYPHIAVFLCLSISVFNFLFYPSLFSPPLPSLIYINARLFRNISWFFSISPLFFFKYFLSSLPLVSFSFTLSLFQLWSVNSFSFSYFSQKINSDFFLIPWYLFKQVLAWHKINYNVK